MHMVWNEDIAHCRNYSGCNEAMKGSYEHRSGSSCAACKLLKRKCTPTCIFAPYFRSDEPNKFAKVHKVFGASNVSKILVEVPEEQREDTVNSLAYEAEARLRDPVYGCMGAIATLQQRMIELQHDVAIARARLACYASNPSPSSSCCPVLDEAAFFTGFPGCGGLTSKSFMSQSAPEFIISQYGGDTSDISYAPYIL